MNGHEATRRIRAFEVDRLNGKNGKLSEPTAGLQCNEGSRPARPKGVPIIALTANVFNSDIEDCLAAGMDDHLGKPLDIDRVIEKLRLYLK